MSEETIDPLEVRFAGVARGRAVSVRFESRGFIVAYDYRVAFDAEANAFKVVLRRGGCFEGAYRCIERFIEAEAERLDGVDSAPPGSLDLRREMQYWIIERIYEQFRGDLTSVIADRISWLEQVRPGEGVFGEVTVQARIKALTGFLARLQETDGEVRRALLSPQTVALLKDIGLDLLSDAA